MTYFIRQSSQTNIWVLSKYSKLYLYKYSTYNHYLSGIYSRVFINFKHQIIAFITCIEVVSFRPTCLAR